MTAKRGKAFDFVDNLTGLLGCESNEADVIDCFMHTEET